MGELARQTKEELRQLPLILGKLLGGILALTGFTGWVLRITRHSGTALPWFLVGTGGIALFLLATRAHARRVAGRAASTSSPTGSARTSMVPWGLLLVFATMFLVYTWIVTR